jgi:putative SOS response-associated peptidase YedK
VTSLYRLDRSARDVAQAFGARPGDDPWAGGYAAPGRFAPVLTAGRDFIAGPRPQGASRQPRLVPRLWGVLPPPQADDPSRRIPTLANPQSPFWIGNLRNSEFRCLVPATAIMLWGEGTDHEGRRLRHWFAPAGAAVFAMAGVWKDEEVPAFAIVTQAAHGGPAKAGARTMPLVLAHGDPACDIWLHGGWDRAAGVLHPSDGPDLAEIPAPHG